MEIELNNVAKVSGCRADCYFFHVIESISLRSFGNIESSKLMDDIFKVNIFNILLIN